MKRLHSIKTNKYRYNYMDNAFNAFESGKYWMYINKAWSGDMVYVFRLHFLRKLETSIKYQK